MLLSHVKGSRALIVTSEIIAPFFLEKYEKCMKGGNVQIGTFEVFKTMN